MLKFKLINSLEAVKSTSKPTVSSRISPIKEKVGEKKLITLKRPAEPLADEQVEEGMNNVCVLELNFFLCFSFDLICF